MPGGGAFEVSDPRKFGELTGIRDCHPHNETPSSRLVDLVGSGASADARSMVLLGIRMPSIRLPPIQSDQKSS